MQVVTDGKHKWIGTDKVNTGKGIVDTTNPPEWANVFEAKFLDRMEKIKRGPQVIHAKDVGQIITLTGLGKGWKVVEGGSGSGHLTCWLGHLGCTVHSYEQRDDFFKIASHNVDSLGLKKVKMKKGNVFEMKEKKVDLVIFDLQDPWKGTDVAFKALKKGGYLLTYLPNVQQVTTWLASTKEFAEHRVVTNTVLDWRADAEKFRPKSKTLAHTAFICICRKLK